MPVGGDADRSTQWSQRYCQRMAPRLRQVSRAEASESVRRYYDLTFGERDPVAQPGTATGAQGHTWTVLALVPEILDHSVRGMALYCSPSRRLPATLRELAVT